MNFGGISKWVLLIGAVLVFAVCAFLFGGAGLLSGNNSSPISAGLETATVPAIGSNQSTNSDVQLGNLVTTDSVGQGNRPGNETSNFPTSAKTIYVVAEGIYVPSGTSIFARWSRDGQPFEDTNPIVADRDYQNTYVEFHISPTNGIQLTPGVYSVQLYVNGNPGPQTQFTVS